MKSINVNSLTFDQDSEDNPQVMDYFMPDYMSKGASKRLKRITARIRKTHANNHSKRLTKNAYNNYTIFYIMKQQ